VKKSKEIDPDQARENVTGDSGPVYARDSEDKSRKILLRRHLTSSHGEASTRCRSEDDEHSFHCV
jgi:hypothetical protein